MIDLYYHIKTPISAGRNWIFIVKLIKIYSLDLQKFNNAMLAKQVWHFIHNKDTLVYKVFSAKYFPNGSIHDALVHPKG